MGIARSGLVCAMLAAAACPSPSKPIPARPEPVLPAVGLQLHKADLARSGLAAELIQKLVKSRFRYFRMLAERFEVRTCAAFADTTLPLGIVHGDPHVEQFVVTTSTYGLEDFDRAGFGPIVVDLVRYVASLHVACSDVDWPCDAGAAAEHFLDAYRDALTVAPSPSAPPAVVQRLRAKAPTSRISWLAWAETLMVPLAPDLEDKVRRSWAQFGAQMQQIRPEWPRSTYDIEKVGSLSLGFGSALERKILMRIAGPTPSPDDDLIVEAREVPPVGRGCVWRASYGESLILLFTSVLGRRMPELHGFAPLLGTNRRFWLQSWDPGYEELAIHDIESQAELEELAIDAGHQLGGPLWTKVPEELRRYQRYAQLSAFETTRTRAAALGRELAQESNAAWAKFRVE